MTLKLGILASHPIQYQAPLFRELAQQCDLHVYFAHRQSAQAQADAGFGVAFEWDIDLLTGYPHHFLNNDARHPGTDHFGGCSTPEIAEVIKSGGFDVFLVLGWHLKCFWQAVRACRRARLPVMVRGDSQLGTPRGRLKQLAKVFLYPLLLRQFDGFLYVGQRNREYLLNYGVPANRLFFSPHCVDNDAFSTIAATINRAAVRTAIGLEEGTKAVLFVGKLLGRKRPHDLIGALALLRARGTDVCAVFAGDGPLRGSLEQAAVAMGVPAIFLGFRNQTELPEAYVIADLLALPSEGSETWGLVANEALACGTPIVVSDAAGSVADLVTEGVTGASHLVGDIHDLANAIERAFAIPHDAPGLNERSQAYSVSAATRGIVTAALALSHKELS